MILVTGGAGFIGSHLVRQALEGSRKVKVIDIAPGPQSFPSSPLLTYRQGDVNRVEKLFAARRSHDLKIVHLAAETSVSASVLNPLSTIRTNVRGTCALLEYARKSDASCFVFASSAAVYGDKSGACREEDPPEPRSPYAVSKLAGEYYCRMYAKVYGIRAVILRYFNVYGPGQSRQYAGVITQFLKAVSRGRPPTIYGDGKQTRDFIFVNDVVRATLNSLNRRLPAGVIINIGSGRAISVRELASRVLRVAGRTDLRPTYHPPRQGEVKFSLAHISLAQSRIKFSPRYDLDNGLRLTFFSLLEPRNRPGSSKASRARFETPPERLS